MMWEKQLYKNMHDIEGGAQQLYTVMPETPKLRSSFARKVCSIIAIQLLIIIAVAAIAVPYHPLIAHFISSTNGGLVSYIIVVMIPLILLCPLCYYHQRYPVNYILVGIFTISLAFAAGLTCAFIWGRIILESLILTTALVVSFTFFTNWAVKRGYDFNFLGPFLFGALLVLIFFSLIQIFFPLGKFGVMIFVCVAFIFIFFCGCIVYCTDKLIKRDNYGACTCFLEF